MLFCVDTSCVDCANCGNVEGLGELSGKTEGHGLMVVEFEPYTPKFSAQLKNYKEWYKEFEALADRGHFEAVGVTATFVGESHKRTGIFSSVAMAQIVHLYPLAKESSVRSTYDADHFEPVAQWIESKLVISPISLQALALVFAADGEDIAQAETMVCVTHEVVDASSWLQHVSATLFPPSKLLIGTLDLSDGVIGQTVHLYNRSVEDDMKKVLAFQSVLDKGLVKPPLKAVQSKLLFKKS